MRGMRWWAMVGAVLIAACTTEPASRVPRLGTYAYTSTVNVPGLRPSYSGTVRITYATADTILTTWNVDGLSDPWFGWYNIDAYYVAVLAVNQRLAHRFTRNGDRMDCTGTVVLGPDIVCSLTYQGP